MVRGNELTGFLGYCGKRGNFGRLDVTREGGFKVMQCPRTLQKTERKAKARETLGRHRGCWED